MEHSAWVAEKMRGANGVLAGALQMNDAGHTSVGEGGSESPLLVVISSSCMLGAKASAVHAPISMVTPSIETASPVARLSARVKPARPTHSSSAHT